MSRVNPAADLSRKIMLVGAAIKGRQSASSTSLSASYGLQIEQVRRVLTSQGVRDDG